jgi:hypothetical protein
MLICIGKPIDLGYSPEKAKDHELIESIAHKFQNDIQAELNDLLAIRRSPFTKWNEAEVQEYLDKRS